MVRFFLLNAFIAVHTILFCLCAIIVSVMDGTGRLSHFYAAVPWAKAILWVCGVKVSVYGRENADDSVPRIYMSNHQSYFDIFVLLGYLPVNFKFILKEELMRIPLFGSAMRRAGYIAINRDDPRKALRSMNEAAEKIKNGASVLIFPEGTRSKDGILQDFKKGGFHLALKSGCDIIPVSIMNTGLIVPKGSLRIQRGRAGLCIGHPVPTKDYSKKEMGRLMSRVREEMLRQMKKGDANE
ncbi:MAG: lysophospholipid acyltransferase family protein [Pseudomonadota bacterium]